jgi:hypothetical protein
VVAHRPRRVGLWWEALTVGSVVSLEAWKKYVSETFGHSAERAKGPGGNRQQSSLPMCFPATATITILGPCCTCKRWAEVLRNGGRAGRCRSSLCGVEAEFLSSDCSIAGKRVYLTTTSDMSLHLARAMPPEQ